MNELPGDVSLDSFSFEARRLVEDALSSARGRRALEVTPAHFFLAAMRTTGTLMDALRSAIGDAERVVSMLESSSSHNRDGLDSAPLLSVQSKELLRHAIEDASAHSENRGRKRFVVSRVQVILALLGTQEITKVLITIGLEPTEVRSRVLAELADLQGKRPAPEIGQEEKLATTEGQAWAVAYWVDRPEKTRLRVVVECSELAERLIRDRGTEASRLALETRARAAAAACGYLPLTDEEVHMWFDERTGLLVTDAVTTTEG